MKWGKNRETQLAVAAHVVSHASSSGCCRGVQPFHSESDEPGPAARCRMGGCRAVVPALEELEVELGRRGSVLPKCVGLKTWAGGRGLGSWACRPLPGFPHLGTRQAWHQGQAFRDETGLRVR